MPQKMDTGALEGLNKAYGLTSAGASQETDLDDGNVSQVLDVESIARRSRAPFRGGLFTARLQNDHAVAGELQSIVNPYEPDPAQSGFPFERVDASQWDIWLLGSAAWAPVTGDGSDVTFAAITIDNPAGMQAMSQNSAGAAIAPADLEVPYGQWSGFTLLTAAGDFPTVPPEIWISRRIRLDPDEQITLRSRASGGTPVVIMMLRFGIFPASLGQDAGF